VDQHRAGSALPVGVGVLVVVEAGEGQRAQLGGAPSDPGGQFDRGPDGGSGHRFEQGQVVRVEQLAHHGLW
jgi:hypothetical protein